MTAVNARGMVAVGVDGSPEAVDAARYAVEAARARHLDVLVVCAYQMPMITDDLTSEPIAASRTAADQVVSDVVSQLTVPTTMKVSTLVQLTSPVTLLHRLAETAALVVIGSHHFDLTDQLLIGPVASAVAAHADCPVVVIPRAWSLTPVGVRPIVVALDGQTAATAALDFAFAEAERRTCGVTALHAVPLRDPLVNNQGRHADIGEILAGHQEDHPDIAVRALFISSEPKDAIIDQSFSAAMMVVGRPHRHRLGSWTRSVAKAVLSQTHCPLVVVPRIATDQS